MLCLDESTPVILALSLSGAVLLIVGGSLWGSGDADGKRDQMAAGVGLFCGSVVLLGLAGLGCWCNKCYCTAERKSSLARRFYGGGGAEKKPSSGDAESAAAATDATDAADCGSLGSSFRSFRSSRRSVRRGNSARRDRVQPADSPPATAAGRRRW